ncbi:hypothetical protein AAG570_012008 [Ranatra chinensis]|uniref:RING-type domain-containing protein n=1 Tax=Ranatra chinensis TaxID=642074 RepID=A0ABD0YTY8_9HEMI
MGNCLKASSTEAVYGSRGRSGESVFRRPPTYRPTVPVYYTTPNISRPANQLSEEEQVRIARRLGLIQHLPTSRYDGAKKVGECPICMAEFLTGDSVRYLPCMHVYHVSCIDDWLQRSLTCPSCMEPVDAALVSSYETSDTGNPRNTLQSVTE